MPAAAFAVIALCSLAKPMAAQSVQAPRSDTTGRSIKAISYWFGGGATTIDLRGSGLIAGTNGQARVEAKPGLTIVQVEIQGLTPPLQLGAEFLTYVLWAASPEGRAINLGAVLPDNKGRGRLRATIRLQTFSLLVTAEPYAAVRQPSEMVILENGLRKNTKGRVVAVNDYKLIQRSQYEKPHTRVPPSINLKNVPLEIYEARNAVDIARSRGANQYARDIFSRAQLELKLAEDALARKSSRKDVTSLARQASQFAEDARALAVERQEQERIGQEREAVAAAARAEAEARRTAEAAEARRRVDEEALRQAELAAARAARVRAEAAARRAQRKAEVEIAAVRAKAEADRLQGQEEAARADAERTRQAAAALRAQLLDQFNRILQTRDTARGLVITMADVHFAAGQYNLRPNAREMLAKVSGIVLAHPGLQLAVEGHTDSTGSDAANQKLSEQRATTVRAYLIAQGVEPGCLSAAGFGRTNPVASNDTSAGRQQNRRVELVLSGEVIGVNIGRSKGLRPLHQ